MPDARYDDGSETARFRLEAGPPTFGAQQPSLVDMTNALSGIPGGLSGGAVPNVLIACGLLVDWLKRRRGDVTFETGLARWSDRAGPSPPVEDLQ